jgi:hypothetical protein
MNRAEAMLAALERVGFRGCVDHDLVRLDTPAGLACVALGPDIDGYLVSVTLSGPAFEHRPADTREHRRARKALYTRGDRGARHAGLDAGHRGNARARSRRRWPSSQRSRGAREGDDRPVRPSYRRLSVALGPSDLRSSRR